MASPMLRAHLLVALAALLATTSASEGIRCWSRNGNGAAAASGQLAGPGSLTAAAARDTERTVPVHVSEMIIIASGPRSGSSALAMELAEHPCVMSFNEYFNNGNEIKMPPPDTVPSHRQSGRAHQFLGDLQWKARFEKMWQNLKMVRSKAQLSIDAGHAKRNETLCGVGGVSIVFKLFDTHWTGYHTGETFNTAEYLPTASVNELMRHENATVVVLERSAVDRKCSLDHAYTHHDWSTSPDQNHKVNRTACKLLAETDMTKNRALAKFTKQHDEWFQLIRGASAEANAALRVEVPFDVWVHKQRSRNVLKSIWAAAGLDAAAGMGTVVECYSQQGGPPGVQHKKKGKKKWKPK